MNPHPLLLALLLTLAASCAAPEEGVASAPPGPPQVATLGVATGSPSGALAKECGLEFEVRWVGRVIDALDAGGPAERAGLRVGDVIVSADGVRLFSQDDLDDLLRVSEPGQSISLQVLRSDDSEPEPVSIEVTLGSRVVAAAAHEPLRWQYASLAQLPLTLGAAREKHKRVLVGLSGAET